MPVSSLASTSCVSSIELTLSAIAHSLDKKVEIKLNVTIFELGGVTFSQVPLL